MARSISYGNNQYRRYFWVVLGDWSIDVRAEKDYGRLVILMFCWRIPGYFRHGVAVRLWGNKHLHRFWMHFTYP